MKTVRTKTTYLEMRSDGELRRVPKPDANLAVDQLHRPTVDEYRGHYSRVGEAYNWVNRLLMADDKLLETIHNKNVEIYLLKCDDQPAGYSELDRREGNEVELAYFGLFPEFIGRGLGKYFLWWTIDRAWSYRPDRVWLHTCDLDHEAALPNYLKAGFSKYDEKWIDQPITD